MSYDLDTVVARLNEALEVDRFRDYGPNGLQVEGDAEVDRVVTGVSANLALFERAFECGAKLVVVHHGLFWGHTAPRVVGSLARRLRLLLESGISLAAYHLPLDAHPTLGNNVGLADAIGLEPSRSEFGDVRGHALGLAGAFAEPLPRAEALHRIADGVIGGADPAFVFPHGPEVVSKVGICSGGASDLLEDAARLGCDLFVTGELAEQSAALARELGITLVGAGHHRTEVYGAQRLAGFLSQSFPGLEAEYVEIPSPL